MNKPKYYVSTVTGEKYDYATSGNFGTDPGNTVIIKNVPYLDLPKEGYPYTIEYLDEQSNLQTNSLNKIKDQG